MAPLVGLLCAAAFQTQLSGGLALVAAVLGFGVFCPRGPNRHERMALAVWSLVTIAITLAWLPLPWARYLMVVLPPVTILAGVGCASLFQLRLPIWMRRSEAPAAKT